MNTTRLATIALAATLVLAGCATGRLGDDEKLSLYQAHAGEPVNSFHYFGDINGWTSLGESAIAVWTRPSEAWLLELAGRCPDLKSAQVISLTSTMGSVHSRLDKVIARGPGAMMDIPCQIAQIRPLDVKTLRVSERELREARAEEREAVKETP